MAAQPADTDAYVRDALRTSRGALDRREAALHEVGLTYDLDLHEQPDGVELAVYFYDDLEVVDVIESRIVVAGRPVSTPEEFARWLDSSIADVIAARKDHQRSD